LPVDLLLRKLNPAAREVGIQALVLRLLGDYCLLYNNTVGLLLKRDNEAGQAEQRHHQGHHSTPGPVQAPHSAAAAADGRTPSRRLSSRHKEHSSSGGAGQHPAESHKAGVVLKHIMQVQLVDELPPWGGNTNTVRANASALLQAVCIRSAEGRRRILHELVATLNSSIHSPKAVAEAHGSGSAPIPSKVRSVLCAVNILGVDSSFRMHLSCTVCLNAACKSAARRTQWHTVVSNCIKCRFASGVHNIEHTPSIGIHTLPLVTIACAVCRPAPAAGHCMHRPDGGADQQRHHRGWPQ
jgi:hypothetical protein